MRHTTTLFFCFVILLVNGSSVFYLNDPSVKSVVILIVNLVVAWIVGQQIDKYIYTKKELGNTQLSLKQHSYGLDSTMDGVGITNENGDFEYVNQSHINLYGYTKKEFLQSNWSMCYSEDTIAKLGKDAIPALEDNGYWRGEAEGIRKNGTTFPQEIVLSRIKDSKKVFCIVRDVTEQKLAEDNIKRMALTNELTHLHNRRSLLLTLDQLIMEKDSFYVLFLDIDRFKVTNDTLGHEAGDRVLVDVATRLASFQDEYTSVFHIGGDEFILTINNKSEHETAQVASRLVQEIDNPYFVSENSIKITVSIGISCYPDHHIEKEGLLKLADAAMYYAKLTGGNHYQFINKEIMDSRERKSFLELELKKAILNQELSLHYQPIVDLQFNKIVGVEALLRWQHPKLGSLSPYEFIPIAEETGLIIDIGRWVIQEALYQRSLWKKEGFPLQISVNISKRQLKRDRTLVNYIQSCLVKHHMLPGDLELEVTESVMENYDIILPVLNEMRRIGIKIAIDDFGTGFSSLGLLKHLPIDSLKIDQTFIRDLDENQIDLAIVKSIIEIGNSLDITITAEGIEIIEQLKILKDLKCTLGQGYYLSHPLSSQQFNETFIKTDLVNEKNIETKIGLD